MTKLTSHLYLIGARACGKSSVARQLAEQLGVDWVDTDHALEEQLGESIAELVEREGWERFRDEEAATLASICEHEPMIVACGGGMVLRPENRQRLRKGTAIYLKAGAEVLAARLENDPNESQRPSLTGKAIAEEVSEVLAAREPLYTGCASHVVDCSQPLGEVVASIMLHLRDDEKGCRSASEG